MLELKPLVISAPFGNYFNSWAHATPTLGTYTLKYRGGRLKQFWRVLRTVRYYPGIKAWKNRLGLPNPGLSSLEDWCRTGLNRFVVWRSIISVMGHRDHEWPLLVGRARDLGPLAVELNTSCPNCPGEDRSDYTKVFDLAVRVAGATRLIVKLPPVGYMSLVCRAWDAGITGFHCCNTLWSPDGGISGKPLQLLSLQAVASVRAFLEVNGAGLKAIVIGGGGVTHQEDAQRFLNAGATSISVASALFNPLNWRRIRRMAEELATKGER